MAEQKNQNPKRGGKKPKKQEQPKVSHKSNWSIDVKRANVERHLAQDSKRARKAQEAATPHGTARLERRRLKRLAAVEQQATIVHQKTIVEEVVAEEAPKMGLALQAMDREAERAGLFPERE